jgi:hypothetical protein
MFDASTAALSPAALPARQTDRTWAGVRAAAAVAGTVCAALAVPTFTDNEFEWPGVLLWAAAVALWVFAMLATRAGTLTRPRTRPVIAVNAHNLAVFGIIAVAIVGLLFRLDVIPDDVNIDSGPYAMDIFDILEGSPFIYGYRNSGHEMIHPYVATVFYLLFDTDPFTAVKLSDFFAAMVLIPALYALGYAAGGRTAALTTLAFGAVSVWLLIFGRIGYRVIYSGLASAWVLVAMWYAFRTGERRWYVLAGFALGVGLHGYVTFRFMPVAVAIGLGLAVLYTPAGTRLRIAANGLCLIFTSLLVYLPLGVFAITHPNDYFYRMGTLVTGYGSDNALSIDIYIRGFIDTVLMFVTGTDPQYHNIVARGAQAVTAIAGWSFVAGLAGWAVRAVWKRDIYAVFLVITFVILVLPSALGAASPSETPSGRRAFILFPLIMLFAGTAVAFVIDRVAALRFPGARALALVGGTALMGASMTLDLHSFFTLYPRNYDSHMHKPLADQILQFEYQGGSRDNAYIVYADGLTNPDMVSLMLNDRRWHEDQVINAEQLASCPLPAIDEPLLFLSGFYDTRQQEALEACYDTYYRAYIRTGQGKEFFAYYIIPENQ